MPSFLRGPRPFVLLPTLLLVAAPPLWAQDKDAPAKPAPAVAQAAAPTPWLYRGSDVPLDKEWVFGELPNGLRYAVRRNGVPPGQVSIRVRIDAGSLHETDSERGYAHFLEHLVFRQSKHLGDGEAIGAFQRLGATFGSDTNAETTPTQTVFKLDLPDMSPAKLDESMRLLSGMVTAPTLSEANVHTDLPIVLAEKNERGGAGERLLEATQETLFAGQRLAVRLPIGTETSLRAATQASVRAFYNKWYRPQNAVVVVVGDFQPDVLAGAVAKYFGAWRGTGKAVPAPAFGDPAAPAGSSGNAPIGETRVLVEPGLPRAVTYAVMRPWRQVNDTIVYNQGLMVDALAQAIINRRLEARARGGGSFLSAQVAQDDVSRSADATFVSVMPLGEDWQAAVRDARAVIADAMETPPTQEEIDREVDVLRVAFESQVEQRRLLVGGKLADDLVSAVDIRETIASPETVLAIFSRSRSLFKPQAVLDHTRALFSGTVTRALLVTPSAAGTSDAALRQALAAPVTADATARLATRPIASDNLPAIGTPAAAASVSGTGVLGIEQVDLSNGVKALIWPSREEPGRVTVKVRFGAGYRAFGPGDAAYAALGNLALVDSGVANLGREELDRLMNGRKLGFEFSIGDAAFEFSGDTRPADLADQLWLFAAKLGMPRWDANPVIRAKAVAKLQYDAAAISPQGVLGRDLDFYRRGRDPRYATPTPAEVEAVTPRGFRTVWQPILQQGPVEVQVFGDIDRAATIAALEKTFGALPPRGDLPEGTAPAEVAELKPSTQPVVLRHRGDATQGAAVMVWPTGGGQVGVRESRELEVLSQLFSNRLLEALREKLGAAYAPQVLADWPLDLANGGGLMAIAQLQPRDLPTFFDTADRIAADLASKPASADELARVTEPLLQQLTRSSSGSGWFMYHLEGATQVPARFDALRTLMADYTQTSPARMQELAAKYLARGRSWRLEVIPEGAKPEATSAR